MNCTVAAANTADEAYRWLQAQKPDALITDMVFPNRATGLDLIRRVRADKTLENTIIIAMTAATFAYPSFDVMRAGADAYLEKPFSPKHLRVVLTELLPPK